VSDSSPLQLNDPEYAFLDANVIRSQLTTDILFTLAEHELLGPFWSQGVIDEMRRNRPAGVTEQRIDRRIGTMNEERWESRRDRALSWSYPGDRAGQEPPAIAGLPGIHKRRRGSAGDRIRE
jgi:hypothetical protein